MIRDKKPQTEIVIDLTGPDGNAFALLAYASKFGKQLGWDRDEIEIILREMRSSDYENLVNTFDKYFGEFIILEK